MIGVSLQRKTQCHIAVSKALKSGAIVKMNCERCGSEDSVAHHEDYNKPLEVMWLCVPHHIERHQKLGWGMSKRKTKILDLNTLGARLRISRESFGYSQSVLAQKSGLNIMAISHFETNRRTPCIRNAVAICDALDISMDWLTIGEVGV